MKVIARLVAGVVALGAVQAAEDIVVADFEQADYGKWVVTGEAFGAGPAKGTLAGQMSVSGFTGKGLVNSFLNGDKTTGTLTSPVFTIERDYLTFLIGGGAHEGKTCVNLRHEGKVVRSMTGAEEERLQPGGWDVRALKGKTVRIQIVDEHKGGWGHVNVDQIVQTDEKPKIPEYAVQERAFTVEKKFLVIPIKNGARTTELELLVAGVPVRRYGVELATNAEEVDWYAYFTIEAYKGKAAVVKAARATAAGFAEVRQEDRVPGSEQWNGEELRPQFHFTQAVGWNNDPNGMVFTPEHEGKHRVHWGAYYASQTFDNAPDGRRIQMGWVKIATPGVPFNQTFSFPHELTLRKTEDGVRMFAKPVEEIEKLHKKKHGAAAQVLEGSPVKLAVPGDLVEVRATFEVGGAKRVGVDIGGNRVVYYVAEGKLNGAELRPVDGKVSMQVLVDRQMIEICGSDGRVFLTLPRGKKGEIGSVEAFAEGGKAKLLTLEVYELKSIWGK